MWVGELLRIEILVFPHSFLDVCFNLRGKRYDDYDQIYMSEGDYVVIEAVQWKPDSKLTFSVIFQFEKKKKKKKKNSLRREDFKSILCDSAQMLVKLSLTNSISQKHCQCTHCCACILYRGPGGQVVIFFYSTMIHFLRQRTENKLDLTMSEELFSEKKCEKVIFLFSFEKMFFFHCERVLFVEFNCFELN